MGREVRMVPPDWAHPKNEEGHYIPLHYGGYSYSAEEWLELANKDGLQAAIDELGNPPDVNDYMPEWDKSEATNYMMYEDTSEGTPISPAFETPEELARWLVDNNASAFAGNTATYAWWLGVAKGGFAMVTLSDSVVAI